MPLVRSGWRETTFAPAVLAEPLFRTTQDQYAGAGRRKKSTEPLKDEGRFVLAFRGTPPPPHSFALLAEEMQCDAPAVWMRAMLENIDPLPSAEGQFARDHRNG